MFGDSTGQAVSGFKAARGLSPTDPVVGVGTSRQLDLEISYLEGYEGPEPLQKVGVLALDPYRAGFFELATGDANIGQKVIDFFEFGDKLCFRLSLALSGEASKWLSETFVEPLVFADYRRKMGSTPGDFFDDAKSSTPYKNFLIAQHPEKDSNTLKELSLKRRPDILRHQGAQSEWYEIKPESISGAYDAIRKWREIPRLYRNAGLPYEPGSSYTPTREIKLRSFITPQGGALDLVIELTRRVEGLIFWTLCVKGDYVNYFNEFRLTVGLLALLAALVEAAPVVAGAAEVLAEIAAVAAALGVPLPHLQ